MSFKHAALLLVDLQNDFCPGGSLAVPNGDEVMSLANQMQPKFDLVVATQDWHPADHASFAANHADQAVGNLFEVDGIQQIMWPTHCVQGTQGAEFHATLNMQGITKIFQKGMHSRVDSYSAFFDNGRRYATGLTDYLREQGVTCLYVMGLATDYCVKFSVLDALQEGFETFVITDGCRGVNLQAGDVKQALADMQQAGAKLIVSNHL